MTINVNFGPANIPITLGENTMAAASFAGQAGTQADRAESEADRAETAALAVETVLPMGAEILVPEFMGLPAGFTDTGDRLGFGNQRSVKAARWTPSVLTGANWSGWSPDAGKVWQDTAGTVAAVADGDPVARIDDLSGNNRHMVQSDDTKRPTLKISGGRRWLEFSPGDWLAVPYSLAGASSVLACAGFEHVDDDGYVYAARSSSSMFGLNIRGNNTTARWMARMSPAANIQAFAPSPYVGLATVATQLLAGGSVIGRRNGVQVTSAAASGVIGHTTGYTNLA